MTKPKDKKKGSGWFIAFVSVFVLFSVLGAINQGLALLDRVDKYAYSTNLPNHKLNFELPEEYNAGYCVSNTLNTSVTIYRADDLGDATARFYRDDLAIVFVQGGTSAIAHEVSHFVDYVVHQRGIDDPETRAYLQGYFTECVDNILWSLDTIILSPEKDEG